MRMFPNPPHQRDCTTTDLAHHELPLTRSSGSVNKHEPKRAQGMNQLTARPRGNGATSNTWLPQGVQVDRVLTRKPL